MSLLELETRLIVDRHHFINKIIASELKDANIFDINKILTYKDIKHYKINEDENIFKLNLFIEDYSSKKDFYRSNKFTNEPLPDWFNGRNVYYYNIIYLKQVWKSN